MFKAITQEALTLCRLVEAIAPLYGAHVGLTGGCLYKDGERKDIDLVLYRIRQVEKMDLDGLFKAFEESIGLVVTKRHGFVNKATWRAFSVDLLIPENPDFHEKDYPQ